MKPFNDNDNFELDSLKGLWQNNLAEQTEQQNFINNQQIVTIMQQKTNNAVEKMQRNLLTEILVTIPMMIGFYFLLHARNVQLPIWAWCIFIIVTFGYHVYLYLKLRQHQPDTTDVVTTLQKHIAEIRGFMKMYDIAAPIFAITVALPLVLLVFSSKMPFLTLLGVVVPAICAAIGGYIGIKWYVNKLYGQHYNTLLECYNELNG